MDILSKVVYALMLLSAIGIIIFVLLQHGKGADMGTGFGAGASGSLFGATGSANFLSRSTAILAVVFFASTLTLSWIATSRPQADVNSTDNVPGRIQPTGPLPGPVPATSSAAGSSVPAAVPAAPAKTGEIPK